MGTIALNVKEEVVYLSLPAPVSLCWYLLIDSLVNMSGHILIPGIYDDVATLTEEEKQLDESIEYDLEEHKTIAGVNKFLYDTKVW